MLLLENFQKTEDKKVLIIVDMNVIEVGCKENCIEPVKKDKGIVFYYVYTDRGVFRVGLWYALESEKWTQHTNQIGVTIYVNVTENLLHLVKINDLLLNFKM